MLIRRIVDVVGFVGGGGRRDDGWMMYYVGVGMLAVCRGLWMVDR